MPSLRTDLVARVCIITAVFSTLSYFVIQRDMIHPGKISSAIPMLFVLFGGVVLVSILYDLKRYRAWTVK